MWSLCLLRLIKGEVKGSISEQSNNWSNRAARELKFKQLNNLSEDGALTKERVIRVATIL